MPSVVAYHRPSSLEEAADLLADPLRRAIGGGTVVVPDVRTVRPVGVEVVDLQDLPLSEVTERDGRLVLGAMSRVGEVMRNERTPDLLVELARRELPSTLRHQATIGGTVALADPDSVLVAGLLVHDAVVELHGAEPRPLGQSIAECVGQRIVTAVSLDPSGRGAIAATGRTPADEPIVSAVARRTDDGIVRLALTGVAPSPIEVSVDDPTAGLEPPGDFRGSGEYRLHLAGVLSARVLDEVGEVAR